MRIPGIRDARRCLIFNRCLYNFVPPTPIYLIPVRPSILGSHRGGLYANPRQVRAAFRHRRCLPRLPGSVAVASWILLSPVYNQRQLDHHQMPSDVPPMWIPSLGYGWDDFPSNPTSLTGLVSSHVVDDRSETTSQCFEAPATIGHWQLQDGVVVVAKATARICLARCGQTGRPG